MLEFESVFVEVTALLVLASGLGLIGMLLRQPLVVMLIATGILAGPHMLDLVHSEEHIHLLAEIGVTALLFLVGLKLDVQLIRTLGPVSVATGVGQIIVTAGIGLGLGLAAGLSLIEAGYVCVALAFSSTIIVVKMLADKREIDSLHGRIALGCLIVQDLAVVAAMVVLSLLGVKSGGDDGSVWKVLLNVAGMLALVGVIVRFVATPLTRILGRVPELLLMFALAWAVGFAALGDWLGFGKELGGLLAGVSLASSPLRDSIGSRMASLRDFLLLFFFVGLGSSLNLAAMGTQVPVALLLSGFVLLGKPLIVLTVTGFMGYRKRTGALAGMTLAQISEFSLIFMGMGLNLGHVSQDTMGLVTLVGLVTITVSSYMIVYSYPLFARIEGLLNIFERAVPHREQEVGAESTGGCDVILFGLGRYGSEIGRRLVARDHSVLGVDFDPEIVKRWNSLGYAGIYGDAADPEFLAELPLPQAKWVFVSIPPAKGGVTHTDLVAGLLQTLPGMGFRGKLAVTSHHRDQVEELEKAGCDLVLLPFSDAADRAVELLDAGERTEELLEELPDENQISS